MSITESGKYSCSAADVDDAANTAYTGTYNVVDYTDVGDAGKC